MPARSRAPKRSTAKVLNALGWCGLVCMSIYVCEQLLLKGAHARKMKPTAYGLATKALINGDAWVHDSTNTDKTSNYLWRANHVMAVPPAAHENWYLVTQRGSVGGGRA